MDKEARLPTGRCASPGVERADEERAEREQRTGPDHDRTRVTNAPSVKRELQQRMERSGRGDSEAVLIQDLAARIRSLERKSAEEQEALRRQGNRWRSRREELGLAIEEVAGRVGLSSLALTCLEHGLPP